MTEQPTLRLETRKLRAGEGTGCGLTQECLWAHIQAAIRGSLQEELRSPGAWGGGMLSGEGTCDASQ